MTARIALLLFLGFTTACAQRSAPPQTVASFPSWFQRNCVATQATYSLRDDGGVAAGWRRWIGRQPAASATHFGANSHRTGRSPVERPLAAIEMWLGRWECVGALLRNFKFATAIASAQAHGATA